MTARALATLAQSHLATVPLLTPTERRWLEDALRWWGEARRIPLTHELRILAIVERHTEEIRL